MNIPKFQNRQRGVGMIEVLVTLIILLVGLIGLAGLMLQSQRAEVESYQRVQALVLLQDMVGRINTNRAVAACYAVTTDSTNGTPFLGDSTSIATPTCTAGTAEQNERAVRDMEDWNDLLTGRSELIGESADTAVGAMTGARGCVTFDALTGVYTVSVAWQGMGNTSAPVAALVCAKDQYTDEKQRRVVSATLQIANLGV
jgi:type IV pilus assembly protein PilV